ncbi:MAG: fibronectin type III domain-containing protein [Armatimonadota bacterium]|nr:fibronectin type III domain-containing protein [Armatimonadota bacterium]
MLRFGAFFACALLAVAVLPPCACRAANNRPLIFGMNPVPMEWWGYDAAVWNPLEFAKMAEAGCTSARIGVNWDQIEPVKGQRDWSSVDAWVNYCLDNNIEPVILINSTPSWALPDNIDPNVPSPNARYPAGEDHIEDFNNWCFDLARRFRGRARYYEFWNEANGYGWYTPWDPDPTKRFGRADLYTPWLIRCYKAVKLADPTAMVSTTGIDDGGDGHAADFLRLMYQYGAKGYFDAVADHPYPANGGPFQSWKLDNIRSVLDANGDAHVKVWITEFGYSMDPAKYATYQQYMTDYFNTLTQDKYDYVRIATWHTAADFPWEEGYGLMKKDLSPKPPYTTFKNYPKPSRPVVSNVTVTALSATSVRINYTTNVPAKGLVMYGPDKTYGFVTARESTASTSHQHVLIGLTPATSYHYRIRTGKEGVEDGDAFSADRTFTTPVGQAVHITSGPTVSEVSQTWAVITWCTDVPSDSVVEYGETFNYGSTVSSQELTTNHTIRLTDLQPGRNYQFRVISVAPGFAAAAVEGRPFTTAAPRASLLENGSFESGLQGWNFWEIYPWGNDSNGDGVVDYPSHISARTDGGGAYVPSPRSKDGNYALGHDVGWASAIGGVYQTIIVPNGTYLVGGWVHAGCDGGDEKIELRAIDGAFSGGLPGGKIIAGFSSTTDWTWCADTVEVTSGKLTVLTRVSQWWAVDMVAGHFDGILVAPCTKSSLDALKLCSDGDAVATDSENVVSCIIDANTFYIQEPTRTAGIRVHTSSQHALNEGDRVLVVGIRQTISGEPTIENASVVRISSGPPPAPLGMTNKSISAGE